MNIQLATSEPDILKFCKIIIEENLCFGTSGMMYHWCNGHRDFRDYTEIKINAVTLAKTFDNVYVGAGILHHGGFPNIGIFVKIGWRQLGIGKQLLDPLKNRGISILHNGNRFYHKCLKEAA